MGKVRSRYTNGPAQMAAWVGRKICNHDPMSALDSKGKSKLSRHKVSRVGHTVGVHAEEDHVVYYQMRNGRRFKIEVIELFETEQLPELVCLGD